MMNRIVLFLLNLFDKIRYYNQRKKIKWIRKHVGESVPNFYSNPNFIPNGCSFCPDYIPSYGSFTAACDYHDWLYYIGGTEEQRIYADQMLKYLLVVKVKESRRFFVLKIKSYIPILIHNFTTRFGWKFFRYSTEGFAKLPKEMQEKVSIYNEYRRSITGNLYTQ